ncbi:MAG: CCA tRNA nucleotidyltransferase [Lentisphaeria bacterium]
MKNRLSINLPPGTEAEKAGDQVIGRLQEAGHLAYRVGGAVRDRLLGRVPHEVDVATDAAPAKVRELFPDTYAVGESFGVIIVHTDWGPDIEVATFREENGYADGRHPSEVHFSTPEKDAQRRDFTVNGLFYDPRNSEVLDYAGGIDDLRKGIIRAIGNPATRFEEDHLRMLRAVRFAATLNFKIEPSTYAACRRQASAVNRISAERIFAELSKMLTPGVAQPAFDLMQSVGLLREVLPEAEAMVGTEQPPQFHPEGDVWQHTLIMLAMLRFPRPVLAWATLLHDVGKPITRQTGGDRIRFPKHAHKGAELSRTILRRLKAPRWLIDGVYECVRNHMAFMDVPNMKQSTLRRLIGRPTFPDELELHRLDCRASHGKLDNYVMLLDKMAEFSAEEPVPPPLITGHDIKALGIPEGPEIGRLLRQVQDRQLEGKIKTGEEALAMVRALRRGTESTS